MRLRTIIVTAAVLLAASVLSPLLERALIWSVRMSASTMVLTPVFFPAQSAGDPFTIPLTSRFSPIASVVIGEPPDHLLQRLILDRGSEDGVVVADVVASKNGVYLGRIVDVRAKTSIMAYISSELNKVTVRIAAADRPLGIVRGQGISGVRVDYLEKNIIIPVGSSVVTSEREENVPAGFFVGVVERVEPDVTRVFQQAILKLPIGFRQIEEVVIVTTRK